MWMLIGQSTPVLQFPGTGSWLDWLVKNSDDTAYVLTGDGGIYCKQTHEILTVLHYIVVIYQFVKKKKMCLSKSRSGLAVCSVIKLLDSILNVQIYVEWYTCCYKCYIREDYPYCLWLACFWQDNRTHCHVNSFIVTLCTTFQLQAVPCITDLKSEFTFRQILLGLVPVYLDPVSQSDCSVKAGLGLCLVFEWNLFWASTLGLLY